jgi:pimeloyl-ACP methyl ester carboxylesterase
LLIAKDAKGLIIFAHGSGSGRASPRNQYVANILNQNGFATFLVDLLTTEEQNSDLKTEKIVDKYPSLTLNKFNIFLLSNRLTTITKWLIANIPEVKDLPIGYFGSSTGAAAALEASVSNTLFGKIPSIISRGGRPDLAREESLRNITSPVLLIAGDKDSKQMIDMNKKALKQLKNSKCKELIFIAGAGHLFEENGAIQDVSEIDVKWFSQYTNQK